MTLHEAIIDVLVDSSGEDHIDYVIEQINSRGTYKRQDGNPITKNQVYARISNYPDLFIIENGIISLIDDEYFSMAVSGFIGVLQNIYNVRKRVKYEDDIDFIIFCLYLLDKNISINPIYKEEKNNSEWQLINEILTEFSNTPFVKDKINWTHPLERLEEYKDMGMDEASSVAIKKGIIRSRLFGWRKEEKLADHFILDPQEDIAFVYDGFPLEILKYYFSDSLHFVTCYVSNLKMLIVIKLLNQLLRYERKTLLFDSDSLKFNHSLIVFDLDFSFSKKPTNSGLTLPKHSVLQSTAKKKVIVTSTKQLTFRTINRNIIAQGFLWSVLDRKTIFKINVSQRSFSQIEISHLFIDDSISFDTIEIKSEKNSHKIALDYDVFTENPRPSFYLHPEYYNYLQFVKANKDEIQPLEELVDIKVGKPKVRHARLVTVKTIRPKDLRGKSQDVEIEDLDFLKIPETNIISERCVLLSLTRPFDSFKIYEPGHEDVGITNDQVQLIPKSQHLTVQLLYNFLRTDIARIQFEMNLMGTTIPRISVNNLKKIYIQILKPQIRHFERIESNSALLLSSLKHSVMQKVPIIRQKIDTLDLILQKKTSGTLDLDSPFGKHQNWKSYKESIDDAILGFASAFQNMHKIFDRKNSKINPERVVVQRQIQKRIDSLSIPKNVTTIITGKKGYKADLDLDLFNEIIDNLVLNALNHGFIDHDESYHLFFEVEEEIKEQTYVVYISNDGVPFPENMTFEKFISPGEKSEKSSGTGLGGWLINEQVKLLHGKFEKGPVGEIVFFDEDSIDKWLHRKVSFMITLPKTLI